MKYRVIKKFYDPFLCRRVEVNEYVDVKDEHLEGYKGYVEIIKNVIEVNKVDVEFKKEPKKKMRGD